MGEDKYPIINLEAWMYWAGKLSPDELDKKITAEIGSLGTKLGAEEVRKRIHQTEK